ncbi:hypothetical protein NHH03_19610 [Stieleria sp. TO1_6]|uniref:hypothetical protein n=1 Tax=Stieleria tagensis TaxID=2956795 RepID=UPI00209AB750|nr:hypothetical protein [Stieleria tagensis]MCO8123961.1 hypothetical protein [Stieleria tagensis]
MPQHLTIMFLLLPAIVGMTPIGMTYGADPPFRVNTKRADDKVEINAEAGKTYFSVKSPFGISQAVFQRGGIKWPDTVVLRLHLKGLENLKVSNGKVRLEASASSQNGNIRLWKDGKEDAPLGAENPYWMQIHLVRNDGQPVKTIPLKDGYFEMQLPNALFEDNPDSITLDWIDFYR